MRWRRSRCTTIAHEPPTVASPRAPAPDTGVRPAGAILGPRRGRIATPARRWRVAGPPARETRGVRGRPQAAERSREGRAGPRGPCTLLSVRTREGLGKDTCSSPPPHRRGRLFCLGVSAQSWVYGPQARSGAETHDLCAHTITAACGAVSGGVEQGGGPLSARRGGPRPSSKRCARAPPSHGVPHSGRRGDRGSQSILKNFLTSLYECIYKDVYSITIE